RGCYYSQSNIHPNPTQLQTQQDQTQDQTQDKCYNQGQGQQSTYGYGSGSGSGCGPCVRITGGVVPKPDAACCTTFPMIRQIYATEVIQFPVIGQAISTDEDVAFSTVITTGIRYSTSVSNIMWDMTEGVYLITLNLCALVSSVMAVQ